MPKPTDIPIKGRLVLPLHWIKNEAGDFLGLLSKVRPGVPAVLAE